MFLPIYFNLCSTLQLSVLCNRVQVGGVKDCVPWRQGSDRRRDAQCTAWIQRGEEGSSERGLSPTKEQRNAGRGTGGDITSTLHILQLSCPHVLMSTAVMRTHTHSSPRYLPHQLSFKIQLDTYLRPETILTSNQFLGRLEIV